MGQILSQSLVEFVPGHLALLYHVSRTPELMMKSQMLHDSITRYKNFMFLRSYDLAQHTNLGIEWVWHVHRLHPLNYIQDCQKGFGRVLASQYKKMEPKIANLHMVEYFDMEYNQIKEMPLEYSKKIQKFRFSFDIVDAAIRQKNFVDQAHIFYDCTRKNFVKIEKDYKMFLELIKDHPKAFMVPSLAIDLMWHTHMRVFENYMKDTESLLDKVLDHNDDVPQTFLDAQLNQTALLWRKKFKKSYIVGSVNQIKIKKYKRSYDDGTLFVVGVWGYPYYPMPCWNSHWNWDGHPDPPAGGGEGGEREHGGEEGEEGEGGQVQEGGAGEGQGDMATCGGGISCGGSTCGGGGVGHCLADATSTGGGGGDSIWGGLFSNDGDGGGGGSSCGGSCGGGCGGGGCGG